MHLEECFLEVRVEAEELHERLGEHVVVVDVEPRLGPHLVLLVACLRHVAEAAVGDGAQLVVVVEDHAAVTRDAEVLQQQVARKDIRHGQVADALPVIEHGALGILARGVADVEVQRRHAPLDVDVADHQLAVLEVHGARGLALQLLDQRLGEACSRELQPLEFLRVDQPAGAVVLEHQLVFLQNFLAQDVLRIREAVADDLEHHVERRQRETDHHQPAIARRVHELIRALLQVTEQLAVALGLALLRAAQHRVQLADRLARQDGLEEHDRLADVRQIDVEIRAREAEQDADGAFVHHDRVDQHAAFGVLQCQHEGQHPALAGNSADQVGARHLEKRRAYQLDLLDHQRWA